MPFGKDLSPDIRTLSLNINLRGSPMPFGKDLSPDESSHSHYSLAKTVTNAFRQRPVSRLFVMQHAPTTEQMSPMPFGKDLSPDFSRRASRSSASSVTNAFRQRPVSRLDAMVLCGKTFDVTNAFRQRPVSRHVNHLTVALLGLVSHQCLSAKTCLPTGPLLHPMFALVKSTLRSKLKFFARRTCAPPEKTGFELFRNH